ncbi:MAG: type IV pilin [Methanosarcina sp.]|nr:type IV pilin [Methanosarcina sp. Ant1]
MDLKKLFKNNDAVSPVIGVILMVAITVILAAAIGSSVFGQGTTKPAPQANIGIKAAGIITGVPSVTLEHLGGDPIHFEEGITKVTASLEGAPSFDIIATSLVTMDVGDVTSPLALTNITTAVPGNTVNIKIIDVKTNQLISNKDVRF